MRRSEAGEPEDDGGPSTRAVGLLNRPKISESWRRRWIDEERKTEEIEEKGIRRRKEENKIALNYCRMRMRERLRGCGTLWVDRWDGARAPVAAMRTCTTHKKPRRSSPYSPGDEYPPSPFFSLLFSSSSLCYLHSRDTLGVLRLARLLREGKVFRRSMITGSSFLPLWLELLEVASFNLLMAHYSIRWREEEAYTLRFKEHWYKRLTQYGGVENDQRRGSSSFTVCLGPSLKNRREWIGRRNKAEGSSIPTMYAPFIPRPCFFLFIFFPSYRLY